MDQCLYLLACMSVCLFLCLPACLSLLVGLPDSLSVQYINTSRPACLTVCIYRIYIFRCLSACLYIYISLPVCLSVYLQYISFSACLNGNLRIRDIQGVIGGGIRLLHQQYNNTTCNFAQFFFTFAYMLIEKKIKMLNTANYTYCICPTFHFWVQFRTNLTLYSW